MAERSKIQRRRADQQASAGRVAQRTVQEPPKALQRRSMQAQLLHIQRTQGNEAVELLLREKRAKKQAMVEGDGKEANLNVEIADTPEQRQEGLRYREELPRNLGLLFLKEESRGHTMADTEIQLSIAYLDRWGKVLEIREGRPGEKDLPPPAYQYQHALEVGRGWFKDHGLGVGSTVRLGGEAREDAPEESDYGPGGSQNRAGQHEDAGTPNRRDEDEEQDERPGTELEL